MLIDEYDDVRLLHALLHCKGLRACCCEFLERICSYPLTEHYTLALSAVLCLTDRDIRGDERCDLHFTLDVKREIGFIVQVIMQRIPEDDRLDLYEILDPYGDDKAYGFFGVKLLPPFLEGVIQDFYCVPLDITAYTQTHFLKDVQSDFDCRIPTVKIIPNLCCEHNFVVMRLDNLLT